jgi:hypothetical protein
MGAIRIAVTPVVCGMLWLLAVQAVAQQTTVATPYQVVGESFFERIGAHWGLRGPGWAFSMGGPNMAVPPVGRFDPSAGANLGFAFGRSGRGGFCNLSAAQGSRRSFTSQTPMVTSLNGLPGFFSDSSLSPFVISYYPVVGGFPALGVMQPAGFLQPSPSRPAWLSAASLGSFSVPRAKRPDDRLSADGTTSSAPAIGAGGASEAWTSSAGRAAPSVAEARRLHDADVAARTTEAAVWLRRGRKAEASGKPAVAKIYYQMAARRASGELKDEVLACIEALKTTSRARPATP